MLYKIGEVPERSKGADCKSVGSAFEGSNPSLSKQQAFFMRGRLFFSSMNTEYDRGAGMAEPFYSSGLHFSCTGCGHCCGGGCPGYVFLSWDDVDRMAAYLGLSKETFLSDYCRKVDMGTYYRVSLREKKNFDCILLTEKGCSAYPVRPIQCRTYPFWDSIVSSREAWEQESRECPGINTGTLHAMEEIQGTVISRREENLITLER